MGETIISVAIIGGIFSGLTLLVKALFTKNSNKELEYAHTERMIELLSKQNDSSERLLQSVENLNSKVSEIQGELGAVVKRVDELEKKINES